MTVRIYVEGGGRQADVLRRCREGFRRFLDRAVPTASGRYKVIACGGREEAFEDFERAMQSHPADVCLLLVDSEGPVLAGVEARSYLATEAKWRPAGPVRPEQVHLMVQAMEAWFVADRQALAAFYGQGFAASSLPANSNPEEIPKADLERGLAAATRHANPKGPYHKTRHGFDLLANLDPLAVARCPNGKRFLTTLTDLA